MDQCEVLRHWAPFPTIGSFCGTAKSEWAASGRAAVARAAGGRAAGGVAAGGVAAGAWLSCSCYQWVEPKLSNVHRRSTRQCRSKVFFLCNIFLCFIANLNVLYSMRFFEIYFFSKTCFLVLCLESGHGTKWKIKYLRSFKKLEIAKIKPSVSQACLFKNIPLYCPFNVAGLSMYRTPGTVPIYGYQSFR